MNFILSNLVYTRILKPSSKRYSFQAASYEQTSLNPLEKKILQEFGHDRFIYRSDAGPGSEANWEFNHIGQRAFIVTQSIRNLPAEEKNGLWNGPVLNVFPMKAMQI